MKEFYAEVDDHLKEYEKGTVTISEDIEFSMRQTVRQITHYIMFQLCDEADGRTGPSETVPQYRQCHRGFGVAR